MVVLDTDILVAFLGNDPSAVGKIQTYEEIAEPVTATSITFFELYKGAYASSQKERNIQEIEQLLGRIDVHMFDVKSSQILGKIYNDLRQHGTTVDIMDQLIASIVVARNELLITRNIQHFSKIPGLRIETW